MLKSPVGYFDTQFPKVHAVLLHPSTLWVWIWVFLGECFVFCFVWGGGVVLLLIFFAVFFCFQALPLSNLPLLFYLMSFLFSVLVILYIFLWIGLFPYLCKLSSILFSASIIQQAVQSIKIKLCYWDFWWGKITGSCTCWAWQTGHKNSKYIAITEIPV